MNNFTLSRRRTSSGRPGVYYLWVMVDGRRKKISTGAHLKRDALRFAQAYVRGESPTRPRLTTPTPVRVTYSLVDLEREFLAYSRGVHKPNTYAAFKSTLKLFLKHAGATRSVTDITNAVAQEYIALKARTASAATAVRELRALASVFERALVWGRVTVNPWRTVKTPRVVERTPLWITPPEFRALNILLLKDILAMGKAMPTYKRRHEREAAMNIVVFRDLLITAYGTGMRSAELQYLRWEDVDFARRMIHVQNKREWSTKSGRQRIIPMTNMVWHTLDAVASQDTDGGRSELVFRMVYRGEFKRVSEDWIGRTFKKYVRKAGLASGLRFHDVRHSFASNLMSTGTVSMYHVQRLLGHSDPSTTQIYSHLSTSDLTVATRALDTLLDTERKSVSRN